MTGKQGNKGAIPAGHQRARVQCSAGCKGIKNAKVQTWPIGEPEPYTLCSRCLKTGGREPAMLAGRHKPKAIDPDEWCGSPVIFHDDNHPEFEAVKAQCKHISEIKNTAFKRSISADIEAQDRKWARQRRDKEEALNFN